MWNAAWPFSLTLAQPGFLAVLAVVPIVIVLAQRSRAGLGVVRGPLAVGLRCSVIAVLAAALAGPVWVRTTDDQTVVFAVDQSDSVPPAQRRAAWAYVQTATRKMRSGKDRVGVLSFAGGPAVTQVPRPVLAADQLAGSPAPHRTNLAEALRLGLALLPADTARRLVIVSDGNENAGRVVEEAERCAALGIPVDVVPLRFEHEAEMLVERLAAPATAKQDEVVELQLVVRSQVAAAARLHLYHNDTLLDLDPRSARAGVHVFLEAGPNRLALPVALRERGVHRFRAVVEPMDEAADTLAGNNEARAFTIVGDAERVLVVTGAVDPAGVDAASDELLARALRDGGIECERRTIDELPADPAALVDCSTLILCNVAAYDLGPAQQAALASFVRDQGGGLIVIGGDRAFSVGGYAHTPLEEVLPVETSRAKLNLLRLSMVLVIDRSGSMMGEKLSMARQAACGAVELLSSQDRLGVLAFDSGTEWLVPLEPVADKAAIARRIGQLGSGGGTDMYPAVAQAFAALANLGGEVRHMIVLTDGQSEPGDFEGVARQCGGAGITISAIAVGPDADRALLARIAALSGGRMYVADSARPLPQIFARETILVGRAGLYERPFTPQLYPVADASIVAGLDAGTIPPLRGQVITAAKPLAQTPLVRPTDAGADPLLAHWQVGLGRTVAFTSGLWPKWGPEWVAWPGFGKLWTQAVRYASRPGHTSPLEVETLVQGTEAHVLISSEHLPLSAQSSLVLAGQVIGPDFTVAPLRLNRVALGRFEASFSTDAPGTYLVNLPFRYDTGREVQAGTLRTGAVLSYSAEYRAHTHNERVLSELARRTGGRVLDVDYPPAAFEAASIRPVQVHRSLWDSLVRVALGLFVLDVAVRRIALNPRAAARGARRFVRELAGPGVGSSADATLAALRGVKGRVREDAERTRDAAPAAAQPRDDLAATLHGAAPDQPVVSPPVRKRGRAAGSARDYTARLLRAKRRARGDEDETPQ